MSSCLQLHKLQHVRLPCPSLSPGACSNSCPLIQWCHLTISFSVAPFSSCPQSFPASGTFLMSQLFTSGDQNTGACFSISPFNEYSGLISLYSWLVWSLCCPRDFQESFPVPHFKGINFFVFCILYCPALTTTCDHWEDHSLDYMNLYCQSNVSAFQHTV